MGIENNSETSGTICSEPKKSLLSAMPPVTRGQKHKLVTEPASPEDVDTTDETKTTKRAKTRKTKKNEKVRKPKAKASTSKQSRTSKPAAAIPCKPTKRKTQPKSRASSFVRTEDSPYSDVESVDESRKATKSRPARQTASKPRKPNKQKTQPKSKSSTTVGTKDCISSDDEKSIFYGAKFANPIYDDGNDEYFDYSEKFVDESRSKQHKHQSDHDSESSIELFESSGIAPIGLMNGQNWCYLNSVFQALRSIKPINEYLSAFPVDYVVISTLSGKATLSFSFINDFQRVTSHSSNKTTTEELLDTQKTILTRSSGAIRGSGQQCVHEFFNFLTDSVECLEKKTMQILQTIPKENRPPPFIQALTGTTMEHRECKACSTKRHRKETWTSLSMPVRENTDILKLVQSVYSDVRHLNAVNCEKCKKPTNTDSSESLLKGPKVLVLQIQNVTVGEYGLQLADHTVLIPKLFRISEANTKCWYHLSAAIVHIGTDIENGHYVAYSFDSDGNCLCFDDETVTRFSPPVHKGKVKFHEPNEKPYLIIYTKIEDEQ